ncbi:MAG: PD-(D/E)XK nuclease family protein, partial [Pontiella sp.]|nr:PD-(D/E)XK nuclease family protein [Pontiella sp.]
DLLCRNTDGFVIFDYKFTTANDAAVTEQYRGQMEIYSKAARHHYPDAAKQEAKLIVVSNGKARVVSVKF